MHPNLISALKIDTNTEGRTWKTQGDDTTYKEASEETNAVNALILDFWPPGQ